ncbi:MAG: iron ABC transporter permease [Spirochaetes bacterium]|nr:iron ABC transporter permease [Spirochaetota bacterium]
MNVQSKIALSAIIAGCFVVLAIALSIGTTDVTLLSLLKDSNPVTTQIIIFRLLRIVMAFVVGAALAASGCIFQAILKNPLAEPYTLGVSGGAALGASIAIITGNHFVSVLAFCGGLAAVVIIFFLARSFQFHPTAVILSGLSLSFVLSSSVFLLFAFSKPDTVHKALMWLWGDLSMAHYEYIIPYSLSILVLICIMIMFHRHLDILSFGSQFAATHGISFFQVGMLFWVASLATSITVAATGIIGFVGLIVPHAVRTRNANHAFLLPVSAIAGGTTLVIADTIGRSIVTPYEIPSGIITGFFGGIFFLILLLTRKDSL